MAPRAEDMPMDDLSEIDDDEPLVEEEVSYNNLRITTVGLLRLLPGWVIAKTGSSFRELRKVLRRLRSRAKIILLVMRCDIL